MAIRHKLRRAIKAMSHKTKGWSYLGAHSVQRHRHLSMRHLPRRHHHRHRSMMHLQLRHRHRHLSPRPDRPGQIWCTPQDTHVYTFGDYSIRSRILWHGYSYIVVA